MRPIVSSRLAGVALAITLGLAPALVRADTPEPAPVPILYTAQPPLSDPRAHDPGFAQEETILPAGYVAEPGRRPLPAAMIRDRDVAIPLRDGTVIFADIYRPVGKLPVPAILSFGPAGKRGQNNMLDLMGGKDGVPARLGIPRSALSGLQAYLSQDPAAWVPDGYAIVNVDVRGAYRSGGDLDYFGPRNGADGYDVVEFLARQPWSNGKVGMSGNYWYAMSQWFVAASRPPHLAAIAPWDAGSDIYIDEYLRDGIPVTAASFHSRSFGPGGIEDIGAMVAKYPLRNAYWWGKRAPVEQIDIPTYMTTSYTSAHTRGDLDAFERLGTREKWLRTTDRHGWVEFYDEASRQDLKRFFDHYLKGADNGWQATPRVRWTVLDPGHAAITNRAEAAFPLPGTRPWPLHLDAASGSLGTGAAPAASRSLDMAQPRPLADFTFVFDKATELSGFMALKLWVALSGADDFDVFARVTKLDANDHVLSVDAMGYDYSGPDGRLRLSGRTLDPARSTPLQPLQPHERAAPLHEGEIVPVDIPIWPTSLRFEKGEKLRLTVSGFEYWPSRPGDRPVADTHNHGRLTLYTGLGHDSALWLPLIPAHQSRN